MEKKVLFIIVLNQTELLDELLLKFNDEVGQAATVIDSVGMAQHLSQLYEAKNFFKFERLSRRFYQIILKIKRFIVLSLKKIWI